MIKDIKLNLGSGQIISTWSKDWIHIDIDSKVHPDIVHNLDLGLPSIKDNIVQVYIGQLILYLKDINPLVKDLISHNIKQIVIEDYTYNDCNQDINCSIVKEFVSLLSNKYKVIDSYNICHISGQVTKTHWTLSL